MAKSESELVDIAGFGILCALGSDAREVRANLFGGLRNTLSARHLHHEALDLPFFASPFMQHRHHSAADTLTLAIRAAKEAMAHASWTTLAGAGVIVGTTSGTALHFLESYRNKKHGPDCDDFLQANPAVALAREFGASGPVLTISNACASGTDAIGLAMDMIESGQVEKILCGGTDAFSLVAHTGFARMLLYDKELCRPFDATRRGLNLGEGAAFFCLERTAIAPVGRLLGYGVQTDAWHLTAPHPEGKGIRIAIREAVKRSGLSMTDIAFVNAHATGTGENDKIEGHALVDEVPGHPIWASKGQTGHTLGAAGAIEAVLSLLALQEGAVPKSEGFTDADPAINIFPTTEITNVSRKAALSTSVGFGGANSALVVSLL